MDTFICYLSMVPDVIWAAIIASLLTLTGVFLSNRQHSKQQRTLLKHEKEQSDEERKFELRKSVYLSVAKELILAKQHLVNLCNIDLTKNNPSEKLTEFFTAAEKACLIASDDTVKSINKLLGTFMELFYSLLLKAIPIQNARAERNIQNDTFELHHGEVSRIIASMTQFNEENKADPIVWKALNNNLNFQMEMANTAKQARSKAWDDLNALKTEFVKHALSEMQPLEKLTVPTVVALRGELNIPSQIDAYHAGMEKRFSQMETMVNKFLAKLGNEAT